MARWMATIGELDRTFECEAVSFVDAEKLTFDWLHSLGGDLPEGDLWLITAEPERSELVVMIPITERWLRPWPLSLFKHLRVKSARVMVQTTLSLALVHDEMTAAERDELCESVGLI